MPAVRICYQTLEFDDVDIHVCTLRDRQQFADDGRQAENLGICSASWPLFGVIWKSGEVLARLMLERDIAGLRILEVGCGIGLASLVLSHRHADVTATDHHPEAGAYLARNAALNNLDAIPYFRTGWHESNSILGRFDLIVGSDILYDSGTVSLLATFIERHARASCEIIIVDPGRGLQGRFKRAMIALGYTLEQSRTASCSLPKGEDRSRILTFKRHAGDTGRASPADGAPTVTA